jgi:hypothetical protein
MTPQPNFELTPEAARSLALRLYSKEQFEADPRSCILGALDWLDRATSSGSAREATVAATSNRNPLIERLANYLADSALSLEIVAKQIGVSPGAIASWMRGTLPKASSLQKIESFLNSVSASAPASVQTLFAEPASHPLQNNE